MYSFSKKYARHLLLFILLISSSLVKAQFYLPDTIMVCSPGEIDIEMGYGINTSNILADIENTNFTSLNINDNKFSEKIFLDFPFNFYGFDYTEIVICSNNFLSFNSEYHHAFAPLTIDIALPNSSNTISANKVKNAILAPWHDIDPTQGGIIDYATLGTAPNRVFVVRWMDMPHVGCSELTSCTAIFLYENGDVIETHIAAKPTCTTWNEGQAIHALQNDSGTVAEIVTDPYNNLDRNYPNTWTTGIEGVRFTPDGFGDYNHGFIDFIPFVPMSTITWTDADGDTIGSGDSISWNPAESNNNVDVIYIESYLCSTSLTDSVVLISDPQVAIIAPPNTLCVSEDDSLTININYADSVLWSTGETTESIGIPNDGIYSVEVFIDNCTYYDTLTIQSIDTALLELGSAQSFCQGDSTTINASISGATNYLWSDGSTDSTLTVFSTGTYSVDVTILGCILTDSVNITIIQYSTFDLGSDQTICEEDSILLDGYTPNATYLWNDGSTDSTLTVSQAGTYILTVTLNGCPRSDTVTISTIPRPFIDFGEDQTICQGDSVILNAFNSGSGINYTWQDSTTEDNFTATSTGLYHVNIDNGICSYSDSIFITVSPIPVIGLGLDTAICDGEILTLDANYSGATYLWQDSSTNATFNAIVTGEYSVLVTAGICTYSDTINLIVHPIPVIDLGVDTNICDGDSVLLDATYPGITSYIWQDGSTNAQFTVTETGLYYVTLENNACYFSDTINVTVSPIPVIDLGVDTAICDGEILTLDANYSGATYLWQDGSTNSTFNATVTGEYSVLVTAGICSYSDTINLIVHPIPVIELGVDTNICDGESVFLDATYPGITSYIWQDGSTNTQFTVTETGLYYVTLENNGCYFSDSIFVTVSPIPVIELGNDTAICASDVFILDASYTGASYIWQDGSTSSTYSITTSGTYEVLVTAGICTYSDTINIIVHPNPEIELGNDTAICDGDSLFLNATYPGITSYTWQDGSTNETFTATQTGLYFVTLENSNCYFTDSIYLDVIELPSIDLGSDTTICSGENVWLDSYINGASYVWQDSSTNSNYIVTETGLYYVNVTVGSCNNSDSIYITVNETPIIDLGPDQVVCEDENVLLNAGFQGANYTWQDGSTDSTYSVTSSGQYMVTVELNNCIFVDSVQITIHEFPEIDLGPDTLLCEGSSIILNSYSDSASYVWQDGSTNSNYIVNQAGTYYVEVNFNNCITTDTIVVTYSPIPIIELGPDQSICFGDTVFLNAAFQNASYTWQDGSTDSTFNAFETGWYTVDLQLNECYHSDSIFITVNDYPIVDLGNDTLLCDGQGIILDGYNDSASYIWQDGSTNSNYIVSQAGTYILEVNLNGCITTDTIEVTYSPIPIIELGSDQSICEGDSVFLNATFPGASYIWQDGSTDSIFVVTETGTYIVDLQLNNCTHTDSIHIQVNEYPIFDFGPDTILCEGDSLLLSGYYNGASYLWNNGITSSNQIITQTGLYSLEVNSNGCIYTDSIQVTFSPIPVIELGPDLDLCEGDSIDLNAYFTGASYLWNTGDTSATIIVSTTGIYIVDLNLNNCLHSDTISITVYQYPSFSLGNDTSICDEEFFTLDVSSVNGTYLWQNGDTSGIYTISQAGVYHVAINNNGCISYDTIEVFILPLPTVSIGDEIALCYGDSITLDATYPGATYLWNTGSTNPTIVIDSTGIYSVTLTLNGCTFTDDVVVTVYPIPEIFLEKNYTICEGETYSINASYSNNNATYLWMDGSTNAIMDPAYEGMNIVTVELNGCYFTDSLNLAVSPLPIVDISDTTICEGETYLIDANTQDAVAFEWQDGTTKATYLASEEGWYIVQVENEYCYAIDSAYLTVNQKPQNGLPADTTMCEGGELIIDFENEDFSYFWQDSSISNNYVITEEGFYSLAISNECGTSIFNMLVIPEDCSCALYLPNAFSPGNGGINETFEVFPDCELTYFSLSIFNRWGKMVFQSKDFENEWDGTYQGGILAQDVYVYTLEYSFVEERKVQIKQGTITLLR